MRSALLRHAIPLVRTHGFTRQALSLAPLSLQTPHAEPLSDTAVSVMFGPGDEARKTLIQAWLEEGINQMGKRDGADGGETEEAVSVSVRDALRQRLHWNEPVLEHLPEAFALLSLPQTTIPFPLLDPRPAVSHAARVADKASRLSGSVSTGTAWYTQRSSLALVYTAAELHQITSPATAFHFLDTLLESSHRAGAALADAGDFANYLLHSWTGIIKSKGFV